MSEVMRFLQELRDNSKEMNRVLNGLLKNRALIEELEFTPGEIDFLIDQFEKMKTNSVKGLGGRNPKTL